MTARRALVGAVLVMLALPRIAPAHTGGTTGFATITIDGATVRYRLTLWPAALPPAVGADLTHRHDWMLAVVGDKIMLVAHGTRCAAGAGEVVVPTPPTESLTLVVEFRCAEPVRDLVVRDDLFDVLGADYHTLARIDAPGHSTQFAFAPDARETRVRLDGGGPRGLASFLRLGIEHILTGWITSPS